jgi:pimeloyl-ACP methyl ester carboxylesterase
LTLGSAVETPGLLSDQLIRHFFSPSCATRDAADNLFRYLIQNDGSHTIALEHQLPEMNAPTTLIWGTADQYFPLEWAYWLLERVGSPSLLHVIPAAKLYMHFDRPQTVAALVHLAITSTD